jgi:hypothetical protein
MFAIYFSSGSINIFVSSKMIHFHAPQTQILTVINHVVGCYVFVQWEEWLWNLFLLRKELFQDSNNK